jgi:hypothetical protein
MKPRIYFLFAAALGICSVALLVVPRKTRAQNAPGLQYAYPVALNFLGDGTSNTFTFDISRLPLATDNEAIGGNFGPPRGIFAGAYFSKSAAIPTAVKVTTCFNSTKGFYDTSLGWTNSLVGINSGFVACGTAMVARNGKLTLTLNQPFPQGDYVEVFTQFLWASQDSRERDWDWDR